MASAPDDALYHQTKTSIGFWCRQRLNSKSLIQLSETLPVEQTGTHVIDSNLNPQLKLLFFFSQIITNNNLPFKIYLWKYCSHNIYFHWYDKQSGEKLYNHHDGPRHLSIILLKDSHLFKIVKLIISLYF